jgi:hypothetical protein
MKSVFLTSKSQNFGLFDNMMNIEEYVRNNVNDLAKISFHHPLGFSKLVLRGTTHWEPQIRMHIWHSTKTSDIHDHPWNFRSLVLKGALENRFYRLGNGRNYNRLNCFSSGTRNGFSFTQQGSIGVRLIQRKTVRVGQQYSGNMNLLHSSSATQKETISLFYRTQFLRHDTTVLRSSRNIPGKSAPTGLTVEQYWNIIAWAKSSGNFSLSNLPS